MGAQEVLRRPLPAVLSHSVHRRVDAGERGELEAHDPRPCQDPDASDSRNAALLRMRLQGSTRRLRVAFIVNGDALPSMWKEPSAVATRQHSLSRAAQRQEVACDSG